MKRYSGDIGSEMFWSPEIYNQKSYITKINFVNMPSDVINERYAAASIKTDLTDTSEASGGMVYGWLENGELVTADDGTETQYYIMYVASEGTTILPSNCVRMFYKFKSLTNINFENVDTSSVTNMSSMFDSCSSLSSLDVSNFDTSNVTTMYGMFANCSSLATIYSNTDWNTTIVMSSCDVLLDGCLELDDCLGMFYNCIKLVGSISYDSSKTDVTYANPTTGYFTVKGS